MAAGQRIESEIPPAPRYRASLRVDWSSGACGRNHGRIRLALRVPTAVCLHCEAQDSARPTRRDGARRTQETTEGEKATDQKRLGITELNARLREYCDVETFPHLRYDSILLATIRYSKRDRDPPTLAKIIESLGSQL